jgi:ferrous-iron efflux pump FieF
VDAVIGAGIAVYVLLCSYRITRTSLDILMDRELSKVVRRTIKEAVLSHPDVHGLHDLRTRSTGSHYFFQLHLELDQEMTLDQAHHIAFDVENRIKRHYPDADIIIHQDVRRDQR